MCLVVVDALNAAEFHKPDYGDTIAMFLERHVDLLPPWLKFVVTVDGVFEEITRGLPFCKVTLDPINNIQLVSMCSDNTRNQHDALVIEDLNEYILHRIRTSRTISENLALTSQNAGPLNADLQTKIVCFLQNYAQGCFLYVQLLLNLVENGSLVLKSSNFQILPLTLPDIFLLLFNLKFPTMRSFEKILPILNVCLATLYPLTTQELCDAITSTFVNSAVEFDEFSQRISSLREFLWQRRDGTFVYFHPAFRDWLLRKEQVDKFECDLRKGHCLLAFKLSRADRPLAADKILELGHHILKAHIYKNVSRQLGYSAKHMQAIWLSQCARNLHTALTSIHNVFTPNVKVSRLVLLAGANPNSPTDFLYKAPLLCIAARQGLTEMVNLLLEFGANVNVTGEDGCSALSYASQGGHIDIMRRLVECRARINQCDNTGSSAAVHAAKYGQLDALNVLLQYDWSAYRDRQPIRNEVMQQSLVVAACEGHSQICEFLLNLKMAAGGGFDINFNDTLHGETALTMAALHCRTQTIQVLLQRRADVNVCNARGIPALLHAARAGNWEGLELLMQYGAELETCDRQQRTALMIAAAEGQAAVLDMLLSKGASVDLCDRDVLTALCWACVRGHVSCAQTLVEHGASVTHHDRSGRSPLDLATLHGDHHVVQYLLERGANMEETDSSGMRPLDRAIGARNTPVVMCFLRKGAKLGPATWAMAQGKPDILTLLLNKLMEDGNILYRKNRIRDAAHRYQYALKKFPPEGFSDDVRMFRELKLNLMLNLSRCKRKTCDFDASIELATKALELKPRSFEAFYARARAYRDIRKFEHALQDLRQALKIAPDNQELQRLFARVQTEHHTQTKTAFTDPPNMVAKERSAAVVTKDRRVSLSDYPKQQSNMADSGLKMASSKMAVSSAGNLHPVVSQSAVAMLQNKGEECRISNGLSSKSKEIPAAIGVSLDKGESPTGGKSQLPAKSEETAL